MRGAGGRCGHTHGHLVEWFPRSCGAEICSVQRPTPVLWVTLPPWHLLLRGSSWASFHLGALRLLGLPNAFARGLAPRHTRPPCSPCHGILLSLALCCPMRPAGGAAWAAVVQVSTLFGTAQWLGHPYRVSFVPCPAIRFWYGMVSTPVVGFHPPMHTVTAMVSRLFLMIVYPSWGGTPPYYVPTYPR